MAFLQLEDALVTAKDIECFSVLDLERRIRVVSGHRITGNSVAAKVSFWGDVFAGHRRQVRASAVRGQLRSGSRRRLQHRSARHSG